MNGKKLWIIGLLSTAAAALSIGYLVGRARAAGIPATNAMTYGGVLTDTSGTPLTGSKNIQLTVWDAASDGTSQCSVGPAAQVLVAGGIQVTLPDACTTAVHANPDLWIEAFVDGSSLGRTKLGAVPYAIEADHVVSAMNATNANTAATALAAGGQLATALNTLQTSVAALKAAPAPLTTIHGETITTADDTATGGFASQCLTVGMSSSNAVTHACTLAANRKCTSLGYAGGVFVGESDGTFLSIFCIK